MKNLNFIEESLIKKYPELIWRALTDDVAREEIEDILMKEYASVAPNLEAAKRISSEIVGTGIIEDIIANELDITDICFDGNNLVAEGINTFHIIKDNKIDEAYVQRLMQKFATTMGKDFSRTHSRLKGVFGNIRLSATHHSNTTGGTTFSMRIVRPILALNEKNFEKFAPSFVFDFYKNAVSLYSNILIAGITGTGKTELQKLGISFTPSDKEKIGVIQDVAELFAKELNPDKIIYEWIAKNGVSHDDLITDAMRNYFRWIIVSEIIDGAAYALYQAIVSGHGVITTLHSKNALSIPKRFAQLAKFAPEAKEMPTEMLVEDLEEFVDFGFHIEKETLPNNQSIRFLNEIAAYEPNNSRIIFKQYYENGYLFWETFTLPEEFKTKLERKGIINLFQENASGKIPLNLEVPV